MTTTTRSRPEVSAAAPVARRRSLRGYFFVLPALLFYVTFAILPALHTAYLSLFDWDGITLATFVGLANYLEVLTDPDLRAAVVHALVLVVFFSWIPIVLGMLMVGLLARHRQRGMTAFRVLFFLPQIVPLVAVGITWRWMYGEDGVVNQVLRLVGLDAVTRAWLGDFDAALIAVGLVGTWAMSGLCMMLFLSGVQKVDTNLYEAARIDGASAWQQFRSITFPLLRPVSLTVTLLIFIFTFKTFDTIFLMTGGGPGGATEILPVYAYNEAFEFSRFDTAAVATTTLLVVPLALSIVYFRALRAEERA